MHRELDDVLADEYERLRILSDMRGGLKSDIERLYGQIADLRDADLGDLWALARDLVVALDEWDHFDDQVSGRDKMDVAVDVAWDFIEERGGLRALRERLEDVLPLDFVTSRLLRWLLTEERAKALIRFVLELAVREVRRFWDDDQDAEPED